MKRIILIGNPNVGKSAIFSRLTGIHATTSNYSGTTVEYKDGIARFGDEEFEVIDTPGTYSLDPTNDAERAAVELLMAGDIVVNVLDSTNLERNLLLTMQLLEEKIPLIVCLNMFDDAEHRGIQIDVSELSRYLRVPVIPTVGISGAGVSDLASHIVDFSQKRDVGEPFPGIGPHSEAEKWVDLGEIISRVQNLEHRHHTLLERLQDISLHPVSGPFVALAVLALSFVIIRFLGEGLIGCLLDPLFEGVFRPVLDRLSGGLANHPLPQHVLIGELVNGEIDFVQSMGVLTTGLYVPLAMVMPYVTAFYLVLSVLEDVGYLPRLGVLMDGVMHRIGMHGWTVIPMLLGFGCNVPGILATRSLESRRQRFIACTLISIGVPCVSLQAMILKLVGAHGLRYVAYVYAYLGMVIIILGQFLRLTVRGHLPELILEIPPYRLPAFRTTVRKLWYRIKGFFREAVPLILGGIAVLNVLDYFHFLDVVAGIARPVMKTVWGLPEGAVLPVIMGLLRKDIAAGMLVPLGLSLPQLMTGTVLLAMTFPCVATLAVLLAELGLKDTLKSTGLMAAATLVFGAIANAVFRFFV